MVAPINPTEKPTCGVFFGGDVFCFVFFFFLSAKDCCSQRGKIQEVLCLRSGGAESDDGPVCKISLTLKLVCSFSLGEFVPLELTSFIGLIRLIRDVY